VLDDLGTALGGLEEEGGGKERRLLLLGLDAAGKCVGEWGVGWVAWGVVWGGGDGGMRDGTLQDDHRPEAAEYGYGDGVKRWERFVFCGWGRRRGDLRRGYGATDDANSGFVSRVPALSWVLGGRGSGVKVACRVYGANGVVQVADFQDLGHRRTRQGGCSVLWGKGGWGMCVEVLEGCLRNVLPPLSDSEVVETLL
jgi:hypothetical protein